MHLKWAALACYLAYYLLYWLVSVTFVFFCLGFSSYFKVAESKQALLRLAVGITDFVLSYLHSPKH